MTKIAVSWDVKLCNLVDVISITPHNSYCHTQSLLRELQISNSKMARLQHTLCAS
jgi:hypothetical protein